MRLKVASITLSLVTGLAAAAGCTNREAMAQQPNCTLGSELATAEIASKRAQASASRHATGSSYADLFLSFPLSDATDPPVLMVTAAAGEGAFAHGVAAGGFELRGEDVDPVRCGLCITVIGPLDAAKEQPIYTYTARSGTLKLSQLGGEGERARVRGTLEHVRFNEVGKDEKTGRFTPRGCTTRIKEVSFDLPLEEMQGEVI